jgi:PPIC-type peptidyl-prolyl cis-trans isomerase-like protein
MRTLALTLVVAAVVACSREPGPDLQSRLGAETAPPTAVAAVPASAAEEATVAPYPPGRWRLARPDEMYGALVRSSHVLIRHEGVQEGIVSFQLPDWTPSPPPPARTREQARALAEQVADRLQKHPDEFAAVAREVSEDVATQALGGALGTRSAAEFLNVPEVLDALAALGPGEVSRVVETQYGFHIIQKRPPAAEQTVSGARILIAHDQAPWLGLFLARRPLPPRTREEAMRIAQSIYERIEGGESFDKLAREYSDHREAVRGGDFGAWSTRETTPFPREIEILAELDVGQMHSPLDSPFGVEIIRREPNRPRQNFAMTTVQQGFDPRVSEAEPSSRGWVLNNIRALSQQIVKQPSKFVELQKQYCCARKEQWIEGRGEAEAEAMLSQLRLGEIAAQPTALAAAFGIIQRLEPGPVNAQEWSLELPAPEKPDIAYLVLTGRLRVLLRGFAPDCAEALRLEPAIASQFTGLLDEMVNGEELERPERAAQFEQVQSRALALLGTERFQRYLQVLGAHVEKQMLKTALYSPRGRLLTGSPVSAR